jgi:hypothetical protein
VGYGDEDKGEYEYKLSILLVCQFFSKGQNEHSGLVALPGEKTRRSAQSIAELTPYCSDCVLIVYRVVGDC